MAGAQGRGAGVSTTDQLLLRILDKLEEIRVAQGDSASSAQVNTSTRGHDITVKVYPGSPVAAAGNTAVSEYVRLKRELEDQLMAQWPAEVARRTNT